MGRAKLVVLILVTLILLFLFSKNTEKKEKMSILAQTRADGIRDRMGNTNLDYDLTALMRTQTGLPISS